MSGNAKEQNNQIMAYDPMSDMCTYKHFVFSSDLITEPIQALVLQALWVLLALQLTNISNHTDM